MSLPFAMKVIWTGTHIWKSIKKGLGLLKSYVEKYCSMKNIQMYRILWKQGIGYTLLEPFF